MRKIFICPICGGDGDGPCLCGGDGLIGEADAIAFQQQGLVVERLPDPPIDQPFMCHDCAFRGGSPEREMGHMEHLMKLVADGKPFICHQGMHETKDGRYIPLERDHQGAPVGHPICAGWAAARAKEIR
jgi:hypothetical protein